MFQLFVESKQVTNKRNIFEWPPIWSAAHPIEGSCRQSGQGLKQCTPLGTGILRYLDAVCFHFGGAAQHPGLDLIQFEADQFPNLQKGESQRFPRIWMGGD